MTAQRCSSNEAPHLNWSDLPVFLAAFRTGSLSQTATRLGVSVSTASRRLTALENAVGQPLFARTPHGLEACPAARALLPHAEAVERAALAGQAAISALSPGAKGDVRIALPGDMLILVLLPRLRGFLLEHPEITLFLEHGTQALDLNRRQADIAVRTQPPVGEELIFRRLRQVRLGVFATEAVLQEIGDATDPTQHRWIGWAAGGTNDWVDSRGGQVAVRCMSPTTMRHAACAGLGTALLPQLFGQLSPSLLSVPIEPPPPRDLYLIVHRAIRRAPAIDAVWNVLLELLVQGEPEAELQVLRRSVRTSYGF